ncbi:MAG: DinB family protein [Pseudomonadota bacterium]
MITADYCRLMVRYNAWQNASLVTASDVLSDAQRWEDRGLFFGSIAATLNHLLWDDALWLERFAGNERPEDTLPVALDTPSEWDSFKAMRTLRDDALAAWAADLTDDDIQGRVAWYPAGGTQRVAKARAVCIAHLFNHQAHHRGQVHGMLTAAGTTPDATDLAMLG